MSKLKIYYLMFRSTKTETIKQLQEFERMLKEMQSGDLTLLDQVKKTQMVFENF
jgi:hypothetical protein